MKTKFAAVLNGALVLATSAGFLSLNAAAPDQGWAIVAYIPSLLLAAGAAFVSIGGLDALQALRGRDAGFCAMLAVAWTAAQVAFASLLATALLPADWLSLDDAKAWLLAGTAAQAVLVAIMVRAVSRWPSRDLKLK